jgi:hypothetical protein
LGRNFKGCGFSFDKKFFSVMILNVMPHPLNWSGEAGKEAKWSGEK